ncbi:MAG: DUF4336 domain-containing protein [Aquidulcibacter sp.]|jgi:hypothetical protein|uniref:DUF4336 domain-containing protein n=1 Tax=Aquidulcibacter sp. TaxID=2052990 RepID=UPI0022BB0081|nr:DUF4336 domain-containing protein [Aquidulcibacter sp.]MCE2890924.1 DUF4336 domain-containing protein [Hyphomonadaceae bacterium]MCZ8209272.1 DUF4336 domain-containing protein [Aquidulcibacter sp.]
MGKFLSSRATGYEPLFVLKPVARDVWIADGSWIRFYGLPFPTRMTVIRLSDGSLWVHSPIADKVGIADAVAALGEVRYLIAPNWIHYAWIPDWQAKFRSAVTWGSPGVVARADKYGVQLQIDHELDDHAPPDWEDQIDQRLADSGVHREVVFFHRASRTLVLTDLIENFEKHKMPLWVRPLLKLGRVCDPDGRMPRDMALSFSRRPKYLLALVKAMIDWSPERIILAHGRWYEEKGEQELRRAFRDVLRA